MRNITASSLVKVCLNVSWHLSSNFAQGPEKSSHFVVTIFSNCLHFFSVPIVAPPFTRNSLHYLTRLKTDVSSLTQTNIWHSWDFVRPILRTVIVNMYDCVEAQCEWTKLSLGFTKDDFTLSKQTTQVVPHCFTDVVFLTALKRDVTVMPYNTWLFLSGVLPLRCTKRDLNGRFWYALIYCDLTLVGCSGSLAMYSKGAPLG